MPLAGCLLHSQLDGRHYIRWLPLRPGWRSIGRCAFSAEFQNTVEIWNRRSDWKERRNLVRPERFELPTYCSGGNQRTFAICGIKRLQRLYSEIMGHYWRQLNTF